MNPRVWLVALVLALATGVRAETNAVRFTAEQRLEPDRLKATQEARERFAKARRPVPEVGALQDFRAVIHVHAEDSDHTKGTRAEVLAAAKQTGVRIVMFTDHRGPRSDTWRGLRDGVLFIAGSEDDDGKLRFPEFGSDGQPREEGALKLLTHVEERYDADLKGFAGMEICNRHTDQKLDPGMNEHLRRALGDPNLWRRLLNDFKKYPDEVFAAGCDPRAEIFAKWDRELHKGRVTGIGANDAHQNVIHNGVTFDPYAISFRNLSTHILAKELTEPEVRQALREGHCYVSHDWLADPSSFEFGAVNNYGVYPMGDKAPLIDGTRLVALTPVPASLKLVHGGAVIAQAKGTNLTFKAKKPGAYRVEAWLEVAGEERPWIYSNPVYLEEQSIFSLRLPNAVDAPGVEVKKDIPYVTAEPAAEPKHRLDLYVPKADGLAPVFLFVHGGAWRFGDKALYPPVGHRFAKEGILTVIPSYRLAPKNPWPAQAEDTAAALAWTVSHVAAYGGDTNRIFIGGHSAGGHLTSLITFNERFLKPYGLTPALIRGVISLSGVYNLDMGDALASVFGVDPEVRRDASPQFFVKSPAPPFLVTYCEWDYPMLPAQARMFDAALRRSGVKSELYYTPKENHIMEMVAFTHDEDPTAKRIARFILDGGK
ncbi:MAG TPA: alpha/beta fold hydrolase [Verrucomicrobiae bacterium]|nr:alpha/beta fold hydrolase [Verrucomicrobiae bacterium]